MTGNRWRCQNKCHMNSSKYQITFCQVVQLRISSPIPWPFHASTASSGSVYSAVLVSKWTTWQWLRIWLAIHLRGELRPQSLSTDCTYYHAGKQYLLIDDKYVNWIIAQNVKYQSVQHRALVPEVVGLNLLAVLEVTLGSHSGGSISIPKCKIGTRY